MFCNDMDMPNKCMRRNDMGLLLLVTGSTSAMNIYVC
jgi:hypothetical protein